MPRREEGAESLDTVGADHDKRDDPLVGEPEQQCNSPHSGADKQEGTQLLYPYFDAKTADSHSSSSTEGSVRRRAPVFPGGHN